ncbi:hypothetical protein [Fimbriiglobus ruber]|uniref:Uncharacterized protein n=1 Tax=Fimbriiglobus ruber TaxID=1908690 RepID=A0A225DYZ1_9BACT|nr:hypothetical protein [Fimbriiglobus ruber]OWK46740.1 hypothetical protein FRUB_00439 [Fimbriiglobus ruber]
MKVTVLVLGVGLAVLGLTSTASAQQPCYGTPVVYNQAYATYPTSYYPTAVSYSYPVSTPAYYSNYAPTYYTPTFGYSTYQRCGYPAYSYSSYGCYSRVSCRSCFCR